ncbi:MAG TPA: STAS domain-containing protein [Acidimicrobiales bacterium]|nr:STAS domain-containing protein [Acidimicrobiales bacterium]
MPDRPGFSLVFSRALGKVIVHVHGPLDGISAPALKARLLDIIDNQGNRQVVLDLRKMTSVDAAGLFVLADALKRMDDYGGELLLSGPTSAVDEQLRAVGLGETYGITPEWTHPARGGINASRRWQHDGAP